LNIYTSATGSALIQDSLYATGIAASGAAIYSESTASIKNCKFSSNTVKGSGGVMYCDNCILTVTNSTFNDNRCTNGDGGALYIQGNATIQSSNFTANDAVAHGGAVSKSNDATLQLINTQFRLNTAGRAGASPFDNGVYVNASVTIDTATVFIDNTATCCYAKGLGSAVVINYSSSSIYSTNYTHDTCQDVDSGG
jgi:predicted outer membrane repeat protein